MVITFDEAEGFLKKKLPKLLAQTSTNSTHYANTSYKHWSNVYSRKARSTDGLALQWIQMYTHFWNQTRSRPLSIQAPLFAAPATMKMTDAILKWNKNYSTSFVNISQACFQMLNESISNKSKVSNTPNLTGWNSTMSVQASSTNLRHRTESWTWWPYLQTIHSSWAHSHQQTPQKRYPTRLSSARISKPWPKIPILQQR